MSRFRNALAIAVLATLLALVGRTALLPVDNLLYDIGLSSAASKVPKDIVILGIDEAFMKGRHAYLAPRDRLATLVRNVAEGKPKAIALDVWLDSRIDEGPRGVDAQLRDALRYAKSHGVPVLLSDVPPDQTEIGSDSENGQTAHGSVLPYFAKEARTGSVLFPLDRDGVVRWLPQEKPERPSMVAQMAALGGAKPAALTALRKSSWPIDFDGPPGTITTQSAAEFLEPGLGALLQDQLVFIGATYSRSRDYMPTPYTRVGSKPMYGIEVMAQSTDSIRRGLPRDATGAAARVESNRWTVPSLRCRTSAYS
ncbi:CHASE2 domain-containing protein, partial [bacterium]